MNRFKSVLRHRMRCLEASMAERFFVGSDECKGLLPFPLVRTDAELLVIARSTIQGTISEGVTPDDHVVALIQQAGHEPEEFSSPNVAGWSGHIQAHMSPFDIFGADRLYALLSLASHHTAFDALELERWGAHPESLTPKRPELVLAFVYSYARTFGLDRRIGQSLWAFFVHAAKILTSVTRVRLASDGSTITLCCDGLARCLDTALLRNFQSGLHELGVSSVLLNRIDAKHAQIAYTITVRSATEGNPVRLNSVFVTSWSLDLATGKLRPTASKGAAA